MIHDLVDQMQLVTDLVASKMIHDDFNRNWRCHDCDFVTKYKTRLFEHVEAKHVETEGYSCFICKKFCASIKGLKVHNQKYHKQGLQFIQ